jgi:hypothetical protein
MAIAALVLIVIGILTGIAATIWSMIVGQMPISSKPFSTWEEDKKRINTSFKGSGTLATISLICFILGFVLGVSSY